MEKLLSIPLKLNFTPNTLGCYGLKITHSFNVGVLGIRAVLTHFLPWFISSAASLGHLVVFARQRDFEVLPAILNPTALQLKTSTQFSHLRQNGSLTKSAYF